MAGTGRGRRWWRVVLWATAGVLLAGAVLTGLAAWQNTYELREERVRITAGGQPLDAVLALPRGGRGPFGLVVFVHGDGPADATRDTYYRPLWESFARAGYASLSWNKPGVAGSPGDWLGQSMDDRAAETAGAVAWARSRPEVDPARIGLWGVSQAGWVLPRAAVDTPGVRFVIAVSPAVNWLRQGRYDTLAELTDRHATKEERRTALERWDAGVRVLRRGGSYADYRAAVPSDTGMTARRWHFVSRNWTADATADLRALGCRGIPVLLVLAGRDRNVDVAETEAVYRRELPAAALRVAHFPDATHGLARPAVEHSALTGLLTALFAPREIYVKGYAATMSRFATAAGGGSATPSVRACRSRPTAGSPFPPAPGRSGAAGRARGEGPAQGRRLARCPGVRWRASTSSASATSRTASGSAPPRAAASAASMVVERTCATRSEGSAAGRTNWRRRSPGSGAVTTEPASLSRATAVETWLCGSPVRSAISPMALSGWATMSLSATSTARVPPPRVLPASGAGMASSPIFISVRPSRKSCTPFMALIAVMAPTVPATHPTRCIARDSSNSIHRY